MSVQNHKEVYKDFVIEYQLINRENLLIEGRAIIHGPICSTASTKSTKSDLDFLKFNNENDALKILKQMAEKRIDDASDVHIFEGEASLIKGNKCCACGKIVQN
ncbi:TPA: hypothetical protein ACIZB4_001380 [Legionella pneumophila]|uniref:hypothetical protein n=1 Tax=Legionella pneumophila TaxID=446 RepID=UPI00048653A6|nr:hypothetical protein [Legionella pneumophila]ANH12507.1 hypothetical protein A5478_05515 [Legionella pneumophila]ANH15474.1 hypothetical protein A5480_05510 [Legionella pneumophila]ANH18440.1 hypothetical protein A5479_05510 [Legionella pneumophila]APX19325.1 hypothetical protein A1D14_05510 [Legionella pneumophila]AQL11501.1 hypothetical protein A1D13_05510 [Legionella pneumophila]